MNPAQLAALIVLAAASAMMFALWLRQRQTNNAGVVDIGWTFGIGGAVLIFALLVPAYTPRKLIVAAMTAVWSLRLGLHLVHRVGREPEDGRYQLIREWAGKNAQTFLFWFFQLQAAWILLFALPQLIAMQHPAPALRIWDFAAVAIWLVSLTGESIADRQLAAFRADPTNKGKVCRVGLWRYSRHPNYFFEWLHWFAYCSIAIGMHPWGWLTLLGPALMLYLLLCVTGIPPTERNALRSRGDAYREYQRTTSAFFPWFPRPSSR